MIHIEQNQKISDSENLFVATATGDYEDNALIEFYEEGKSGIVLGSFQAQYVKYGNMVYKFSGHKELGEEILKIDPDSTHTSASFVRMSNQLLSQMNEGSLESTSLDNVIATEQNNIENQTQINNTTPPEPTATESTIPPVETVDTANTDTTVGTTTENNLILDDISSTTPESVQDTNIMDEISTTTDSIIPDVVDIVDLVPQPSVETASSTVLETSSN